MFGNSRFDKVLDAAEELASEACLTNELRSWSGEYDRELLWQEANEILALTCSNKREEIDSALRSLWSYYTFLPY